MFVIKKSKKINKSRTGFFKWFTPRSDDIEEIKEYTTYLKSNGSAVQWLLKWDLNSATGACARSRMTTLYHSLQWLPPILAMRAIEEVSLYVTVV